jgi:hypothetical protein
MTEHTLTMRLFNPQQGYQALVTAFHHAKAWLTAGHRLVLEIRPESKTRDQEMKYHAMIGDIAKQAQHMGAKWGSDDWKRLLIDGYARETGKTHGKIIPNLDSTGVVEVGVQSRKFSRAEGGEFIEWLYAWGSDRGIVWADAQQWTEQWTVDPETGEVFS